MLASRSGQVMGKPSITVAHRRVACARRTFIAFAVVLIASGCQLARVAPERPEIKRVQVNGTELSYVEQGSGTRVVFVHGTAGDWRIWEGQRAAVSSRYRFVAYSRRYHAPNAWTGDGKDYSQAVHVDDLAGFLRALGAGPVHLVGSSYGAQIALAAAVRHPELVRTLTVAEPGLANLITDTAEGKAVAGEFGRSFAPMREAVKSGDDVRAAELMVDAALGQHGAAQQLSPEQRAVLIANAKTVALQLNSPTRTTVGCTELQRLNIPVLVFGGDRSPRFMLMTNDALSRCLPRAEQVTVPDASHLLHSMNPKVYNDALLSFLGRH
jgi:pimeloyl-ACP methyl ester carboxylesterase